MSQGNYRRQQGGGRQMQPSRDDGGNRATNAMLSYRQRADAIVREIVESRAQIEPMLPSTVPFDRFQGTIATALRIQPLILKCEIGSIITACMKAAYDGLMLDGKEAALVPNYEKDPFDEGGSRKIWRARYNPMVAGFRKQIVQSGLVDDVTVTLVYQGEHYRVIRGTEPRIEHEEIPHLRGPGKPIVAVYSVAWLRGRPRPSVETMSIDDVKAIRGLAATAYVWDKNEGEMTRKTCLRRHRKQLPGGNDIHDAEAAELFPDIAAARPDPDIMRLAAPPPPPVRAQFARLQAPEQTVGGLDDFGSRGEPEPAQQPDQNETPAGATAQSGPDASQSGPSDTTSRPAGTEQVQIPQNEAAWAAWEKALLEGLASTKTAGPINARWRQEKPVIDAADDARADRVNGAFTDRLADVVAGDVQTGAGPAGDGNQPAGE